MDEFNLSCKKNVRLTDDELKEYELRLIAEWNKLLDDNRELL